MRITWTVLISAITLTYFTLPVAFSAPSDCTTVYNNATRNINFSQKQKRELSYYFNQHCQKNGEVNESSLSVGIDVIVKQIPFNFSANSNNAQKKLEEFCKMGVEQNYSSFIQTDFKDEVVVAALNSFNQCLALDNRGLRITHEEQPPESVIIHGALTNMYTSPTLDAITYSDNVSCSSNNFSANGKAIQLIGDQSLKIKKNFAITCKRTAKIENGQTYYQRAVIGLATSLGPYTVELSEDQLYGFMLASQAKNNYNIMSSQMNNAIQERNAAIAREKSLEDRLSRVSVNVKTLSIGEYGPPSTQFFQPRLYCGTDVQTWAKQQCGAAEAAVHHIGGYGGNKCGYNHFVVTCLNRP
ncbi:hypothetical protein [Acinetobacter sp. BSP-28]|jgi:hypothetical protein|uniref:hypothetical protein n=1 Tax=Acinetobacter sp. BSP-28 TaxID=3344661 RepID=UPI0037702FC4